MVSAAAMKKHEGNRHLVWHRHSHYAAITTQRQSTAATLNII